MNSGRANRVYGALQSTVFCGYAAVVLLDRTSPLVSVSAGLRWTGDAVAAAGIVLMLVAIRTIGSSIQIAPAPKATATLRTHGVYGWLRHPIYTGIIAVVVGLFLRQPTPLVAAATGAVLVFLVVKSRFEERLLLRRYSSYADYRQRTWGLLPFFR